MLVDSHCHLDFNDFEEDFEDMLARARENGVTAMLNAGNNIDELDKQLEISEKYPFIYTAVGVHPHNAAEYPDIRAEDFIAKAAHKKVVAIGECGLDYYYDYSPKDVQVKVFVEQIKAARETGLPLIIHTRDADDDTIAILDEVFFFRFLSFLFVFKKTGRFCPVHRILHFSIGNHYFQQIRRTARYFCRSAA